MTLAMPEFIARFLAAVLGEAIATAIFAALEGAHEALPLTVRTLLRVLGYALIVGMYLVIFLFCALAVAKAEALALRIGAGLLGVYCLFGIAMLIRKALR